VRKYGEHAKILFSVKPGVTGLWQISGRNDVSYDERIALDMWYIEHWKLGTDIIIMIKTAWMLLRRNKEGAY
jgi:undecaprenyl-phosphate galactose phosphotransferase